MLARVSSGLMLLTLFMFLLALMPVADLEGIAAQSTIVVSEHEKRGRLRSGTPHSPIAIDGDANFLDTALQERWPGDGSPENPYILDGFDIGIGSIEILAHCISIRNTRVSFTISNCNFTGAITHRGLAGIYIWNVTNGELINNTCSSNDWGIYQGHSKGITITNNTCNNNVIGINIIRSYKNTVTRNTCNNNTWDGIGLSYSDSNTVANNTCFSNENGICVRVSNSATITSNTCFINDVGISLEGSDSITVANNICTDNTVSGIRLASTFDGPATPMFNTVCNNICSNNTESGIYLSDSYSNNVANNTCYSNGNGIYLEYSDNSTVANNICYSNGNGIYLKYSDNNSVVSNTCSNNTWNGIELHISDYNTVTHNTCLNNIEHNIYVDLSGSNTVENNITIVYYFGLPLFVGLLFMSSVIVFAIIQITRYRLVLWFRRRRNNLDDIILPIWYRLWSWFRKRKSLKYLDVDETSEPDSSDW